MGCCGNKKNVSAARKRFGSKKRFYLEQAKRRQERLRKLNQKILEEKSSDEEVSEGEE